jgi:putative PIN family toxin of toxin-antitoxin system
MTPPRRIVFDTNVLVSALLCHGSTPDLAFELALNQYELILSGEICQEIEDVLRRPKIAKLLSWDTRQEFMEKLRGAAAFISISSKIDVCRDSRDNMLLDLAVDGAASAVVTGDQDLLVLDPFRKIRILTPRQFIDVYGTPGAEIMM